jgi:DNA-binding transcriptional regulator LsrR (DeoR family)
VLLAAGAAKLEPVLAVLQERPLCNVLCIDEELCQAILDAPAEKA